MATSNSKPTKVNFNITQGDTFYRTFTFYAQDGETPIDLSSATVEIVIEGQDDITEGDGLTVGGADSNVVTLSKVITWEGKHNYELKVTNAGIVKTHLKGYINSIEEIE
jgi:hypothetical protein